jgi:hypothetical protein
MSRFRYTLIADGSSDKTLLRVIKWTLDNLYPQLATEQNFADFRQLPVPPKTLPDKVKAAKAYYPYDILFIHRDAEKNDNRMVDTRMQQIREEIGEDEFERTVCVVPVRMMEAWFLISAEAIKQAAGNRTYNQPLSLPAPKNIDKEKNPKELLYQLLETASGLKGRRLATFGANARVHLVAEYIEDFSPLRQVQAFTKFEKELKEKVDKYLEI